MNINKKKKIDALYEFVNLYQGDLYRFAYSYVKNREDALDIVQDSIEKAMINIHKIRNIDSLKAWLFRIIINEANNLYSKRNKIALVDEVTEILDINDQMNQIDKYIEKQNVLKYIMELDKKYRIIIVLRFYEEFKISEIAKILTISENTVKTRLYKALELLKDTLKES